MDTTARKAIAVGGAALLFGIAADLLGIDFESLGINVFLAVLLFAGGVYYLARRQDAPIAPSVAWLPALAALFAVFVAWRDSPTLALLNLLAVVMIFAVLALRRVAGRLSFAAVTEYPLGILAVVANTSVGGLSLLFKEIKWGEVSRGGWRQRGLAILRGVLIALPLLCLFGALFASADPAFRYYVNQLFDWNFDFRSHLFWTFFWAWGAAGMLRAVTIKEWKRPEKEAPAKALAGFIEIAIALASLDILFLAFVIVQFRFFFGGAQYVRETIGMTYTQYARGGFFELVWVSFLTLPMLLVAHALVPRDSKRAGLIFTALSGALVALLFVIMASAIMRMRLYMLWDGLTELRLYTTAFMGWLTLVFVWFLATVLRGRRERFAFGALVAGFLVLFALDWVSPDNLIEQVNLSRPNVETAFDGAYNASLSADAAPALVAGLPRLSKKAQGQAACFILQQWRPDDHLSWCHWNWGRMQAAQAIGANLKRLEALDDRSCDD